MVDPLMLGTVGAWIIGGIAGNASDRIFCDVSRKVQHIFLSGMRAPRNHDVAIAIRRSQLLALKLALRAYEKLDHPNWRSAPGYSKDDIVTPLSQWARSGLLRDKTLEADLKALGEVDEAAWYDRLRKLEASIERAFTNPEPHEGAALARQQELRKIAEDWLVDETRALCREAKDWPRFEALLRNGAPVGGGAFPGWWPLFRAFLAEEVKANAPVQAILVEQGIARTLEIGEDIKLAVAALQSGLEPLMQELPAVMRDIQAASQSAGAAADKLEAALAELDDVFFRALPLLKKIEAATGETLALARQSDTKHDETHELLKQIKAALTGGGQSKLDVEKDAQREEAVRALLGDGSAATKAALDRIAHGDMLAGLEAIEGAQDALMESAVAAGVMPAAKAAERWRNIAVLAAEVDRAKADAAYEKAFKFDPSNFWTCFEVFKGRMHRAGDLDGAAKAIEAAGKVASGDRESALVNMAEGGIALARGDLKLARLCYESAERFADNEFGKDIQAVQPRRELGLIRQALAATLADLGEMQAAAKELKAAHTMFEWLYEDFPSEPEIIRDCAEFFEVVGAIVCKAGDMKAARENLEKALALRDKLSVEQPKDMQLLWAVSTTAIDLASILSELGDQHGRREKLQRALGLRERIAGSNAFDAKLQRGLASSHSVLGDAYFDAGDWASARAQYEKANVINERLAAGEPNSVEAATALAASADRVGNALTNVGERKRALTFYEQRIDAFQRVVALQPTEFNKHKLFSLMFHIGDFVREDGDTAGATACYEEALKIIEPLIAANPGMAGLKENAAHVKQRLAALKPKRRGWW